MTDLSQTIAPKSDQLNADDLIGGKTLNIRITKVSGVAGDQPIAINFDGDNGKPYKPCKSMRRVLVQIWGADGNAYVGRSLTLHRDDKVLFGGIAVGGLRITHMSHIEAPVTLALTASKASRKPFTVKPLATGGKAPPPASTAAKPPAADPAIKKAGDDAAAKGVAAYTDWLATLAPAVKATVKPLHAGWSATAREADAFDAGTPEPAATVDDDGFPADTGEGDPEP